MASKSLQSAKRIKVVASYSEAEILSVLSELKVEDQAALQKISAEVLTRLKNVDTTKVEKPKSKKKLPVVTKEQKLSTAIAKITQALEKYESSAVRREVWKIKFSVGVNYEEHSECEIKTFHKELVSSSSYADGVKLLSFAERGRLYDFLKFSEERVSSWQEYCIDFGICSKTANRYIDFSRIVKAYPRLLICGLSFETIMSLYHLLYQYLRVTPNLGDRLAEPLRTTTIDSQMIITSKKLPCGGQPPETLLAENADWGPGWNIVDEITESQEKAENFANADDENFSSADDEDCATAHDEEPE